MHTCNAREKSPPKIEPSCERDCDQGKTSQSCTIFSTQQKKSNSHKHQNSDILNLHQIYGDLNFHESTESESKRPSPQNTTLRFITHSFPFVRNFTIKNSGQILIRTGGGSKKIKISFHRAGHSSLSHLRNISKELSKFRS